MDKFSVLNKYFGYGEFRGQQAQIIDSILAANHTLAIMATGGGKSICFQIPGLIFPGITIVVSPLLSLMSDQVSQLKSRGIAACSLNSANSSTENTELITQIKANKYKFIYISPEKLAGDEFIKLAKTINISQLVIDEAHCISQWGHDFRPEYLQIINFLKQVNIPVISLFTATATKETLDEIVNSLNLSKINQFIEQKFPDHLQLIFKKCPDQFHQILHLLMIIKNHRGQAGIIYTQTRINAEMVGEILNQYKFAGIPTVGIYHGGMENLDRIKIQSQFLSGKLNLIVATNAFGMGVDKSNIRYVVHFDMPSSIEAYTQEVGRAGRDRKTSHCYLLFNQRSLKINFHFIKGKRKDILLSKLKAMYLLVNEHGCKKNTTNNYFNLTTNVNCGSCDFCQPKLLSYSANYKNDFHSLCQNLKSLQMQKQIWQPILTNKQLALISLLRPPTAYLTTIPGIGDGWLEKYQTTISSLKTNLAR